MSHAIPTPMVPQDHHDATPAPAAAPGRGSLSRWMLPLEAMSAVLMMTIIVLLLGFPIEMQLIIKGIIIIGAAAFYRTRLA